MLSFYTECLGGNCKRPGEYDVIINEALKSDNVVEESVDNYEESGTYIR